MKIRTEEQLANRIDSDYSWRFFELVTMEDTIRKAPSTSRNCHIRAGIAILYAHWEGFIKYAAECYLQYISNIRPPLDQLDFRFVGLAFKKKIAGVASATLTSAYGQCVRDIVENQTTRLPIPVQRIVNTRANLNSKVFRQIIDIIGLDYRAYELKEKIIDAKLLRYRNAIAHGNYMEIDHAGFQELQGHIVAMLETFKDQVLDGAQTKSYLRSPKAI